MAGKRKFPDVGDPDDPKGFLRLRARFEEALRIANYSPWTVETTGARLRSFLVWCDERAITRPEQVTRAHVEYGVPLAEVDTPRVDKRGTDRVEGCS